MNTVIQRPRIYQGGPENRIRQKGPIGDGSNSFSQFDLVKIASNVLAVVQTGDIVCYGQTPSSSKVPTVKPPEGFFGENHYVFDLKDVTLQINIATFAGDTPTVGSGGATWSSVLIGTRYGIGLSNEPTTNGIQMLNVSDTVNEFFEVVGLHPDMSSTDTNPLVLVKIVDSVFQA